MLNIGVVGGTGRLGSLIAKTILEDVDCSLGAVVGRKGNPHIGQDISEIIGGSRKGILIKDTIWEAVDCDCFIDCTNAENFLYNNYEIYSELKKPLLIATTGFDEAGMERQKELAWTMPVL